MVSGRRSRVLGLRGFESLLPHHYSLPRSCADFNGLGHKRIENTLIYTHLVDFEEDDQFTVQVASNIDEFTSLLENGFEYVSDYQDKKILRKRK